MSEETIDPDKLSSVQTLNIMADLFPPPPYNCVGRITNPDLEALCEPTYREDFIELKSKRGKPLAVYQRNIGDDYDCFEMETLSYEEWQVYGNRPEDKIELLKAQIFKSLTDETAAGIKHYSSQSDWVQATFEKIPVPELKCEIPYIDSIVKPGDIITECDPKTCEMHHHCIYCGSTKVTNETFSEWYKCRSCHKQYEESDVQRYQND